MSYKNFAMRLPLYLQACLFPDGPAIVEPCCCLEAGGQSNFRYDHMLLLQVMHIIQCRLIPPYCLGWYIKTLLVMAVIGSLIGCHYTFNKLLQSVLPILGFHRVVNDSGLWSVSWADIPPLRECTHVLINTLVCYAICLQAQAARKYGEEKANEQNLVRVDPTLDSNDRNGSSSVEQTICGATRT